MRNVSISYILDSIFKYVLILNGNTFYDNIRDHLPCRTLTCFSLDFHLVRRTIIIPPLTLFTSTSLSDTRVRLVFYRNIEYSVKVLKHNRISFTPRIHPEFVPCCASIHKVPSRPTGSHRRTGNSIRRCPSLRTPKPPSLSLITGLSYYKGETRYVQKSD